MKMIKIPIPPKIDELNRIIENSIIGEGCMIWSFTNIYGATIGKKVNVGCFAEIQQAKIGDYCRIGNGAFIPSGVFIGNYCFIGPKACFTTDKYPNIRKNDSIKFYPKKETIVEDNVTIGANATILPGIKIGKGAIIGAGSVIVKNADRYGIYVGNPGKKIGDIRWKKKNY